MYPSGRESQNGMCDTAHDSDIMMNTKGGTSFICPPDVTVSLKGSYKYTFDCE